MEMKEEYLYKESYYLKAFVFVAIIIICVYSALVGIFKLVFPNENSWLDVSICNDSSTDNHNLLIIIWSLLFLIELGISFKYLLKIK